MAKGRPKEIQKYVIEHYLDPDYEYLAVIQKNGGGSGSGSDKVINTMYGKDCTDFLKLLKK